MSAPIAQLTVAGEPRAKARPRVTSRGTYTPKTTRDYEEKIRAAWAATLRSETPACVQLVVRFYLGTHRHVDTDNLVKSVKDALNGLAYDDDWRVYDVHAEKWHTSRDRARTEIYVYSIDPDREEAA
jgi:Holliday junction resolvase RusA-like endonuclease